MSLSSAVDDLLHRHYRSEEDTVELNRLKEELFLVQKRMLGSNWSVQYWDLIGAVENFIRQPSTINLEIMKRANFKAYPFKVRLMSNSFGGYLV